MKFSKIASLAIGVSSVVYLPALALRSWRLTSKIRLPTALAHCRTPSLLTMAAQSLART